MVNSKHQGDTLTRLVATPNQAIELANKLLNAASAGGVQHVKATLEQSQHDGPWGLVIHVVSPQE